MEKFNVYQMVTDRIIEKMNQGIIPWHKPWNRVGSGEDQAISYVTRRPYSILNQFLLGDPGEYLTFNQIQKLGGHIKKGEKSKFVVFFSNVNGKQQVIKENEEGQEEIKEVKFRYPLLRYYHVWHLSQIDGIETKIVPGEKLPCPDPIESAEDSIKAYLNQETSLKFINDRPSDQAYYSFADDTVVVPMMEQYKDATEYYSTAFHELIHSTMTASRCNRRKDSGVTFFGSEDYSREELVAEIGSAMLCSNAGIDKEKSFNNSVAYIQSWIKKFKDDPKMIVWAAGRAEKAARYFLGEKLEPAVETA